MAESDTEERGLRSFLGEMHGNLLSKAFPQLSSLMKSIDSHFSEEKAAKRASGGSDSSSNSSRGSNTLKGLDVIVEAIQDSMDIVHEDLKMTNHLLSNSYEEQVKMSRLLEKMYMHGGMGGGGNGNGNGNGHSPSLLDDALGVGGLGAIGKLLKGLAVFARPLATGAFIYETLKDQNEKSIVDASQNNQEWGPAKQAREWIEEKYKAIMTPDTRFQYTKINPNSGAGSAMQNAMDPIPGVISDADRARASLSKNYSGNDLASEQKRETDRAQSYEVLNKINANLEKIKELTQDEKDSNKLKNITGAAGALSSPATSSSVDSIKSALGIPSSVDPSQPLIMQTEAINRARRAAGLPPISGGNMATPRVPGGSQPDSSGSGSGNDFYKAARVHETHDTNIPNSDGSGAGGYYQFMPKTWADLRKAHPELNLPPTPMQANKETQTKAYQAFTKSNVEQLMSHHIPINDKNVFMSSFLGAGGASSFISDMSQNPNQIAASLFPGPAAANKNVFYDRKTGQPRTLDQVYKLMTSSFAGTNSTGFGPGPYPEASTPSTGAQSSNQTPEQVLQHLDKMKQMGMITNEQCVSLATASVGIRLGSGKTGSNVHDWTKGESAVSGNLVPGMPIATFLDRQGRPSEKYAGGGSGTPGAHLDHAGVFQSYIRDKDGRPIGMNISEQYQGSGGMHSRPYMFGQGWGEGNGSNYNAIKVGEEYLGGKNNPAWMRDHPTINQPQTNTNFVRPEGSFGRSPGSLAEEWAKSHNPMNFVRPDGSSNRSHVYPNSLEHPHHYTKADVNARGEDDPNRIFGSPGLHMPLRKDYSSGVRDIGIQAHARDMNQAWNVQAKVQAQQNALAAALHSSSQEDAFRLRQQSSNPPLVNQFNHAGGMPGIDRPQKTKEKDNEHVVWPPVAPPNHRLSLLFRQDQYKVGGIGHQ